MFFTSFRSMSWCRRAIVIAIPAALLATVILFMIFLDRADSAITLDNFERIQRGMTLQEVKSLLKAEPGDYSTRPDASYYRLGVDFFGDTSQIFVHGSEIHTWLTNRLVIFVWLDDDGKVSSKSISPVRFHTKPTLKGYLQRLIERICQSFAR